MNSKITKFSYVMIIVILISGFTVTDKVQGHDYYKIMLEVQVVDPATMNDTSIKSNVDKMNEIFKPCRIKFNVIKIVRGVEGDANNFTNRGELRLKMKNDLKADPFKGSGAGITITPTVDGDANTNGMTIKGDPSSGIVKDGSVGETWAHEMAHGMGLEHGGRDSNGDGRDDQWDPDGDGNYDTAADKANTMWPFRSQRTDNNFSEKNCEKLNEAAKKVGKGVLNAEQTAAAADGDSVIGKIFDYVLDKVKETPVGKLADLIYGTVSSIEPFVNITLSYVLDGVFSPTETVDLTFQMGYDADNNQSTGITWSNVPGIDKVIEVWLEGGTFYDSNMWIYLYDNVNVENSGDLSGIVNRGLLNESHKEFEDPILVNQTAAYNFVEVTFNMSDLGIVDPTVPAFMVVDDWFRGTTDSANFTLHTQPIIIPNIKADQQEIWSGYDLNLAGTDFSPNSNTALILDNQILMNVTTDANGSFNTTFVVPQLPIGPYYLEAIDNDSNLAVLILDIIANPTSITSSISSTTTISSTTSTSSITTQPSVSSSTTVSRNADTSESDENGLPNSVLSSFLAIFVIKFLSKRSRNFTK